MANLSACVAPKIFLEYIVTHLNIFSFVSEAERSAQRCRRSRKTSVTRSKDALKVLNSDASPYTATRCRALIDIGLPELLHPSSVGFSAHCAMGHKYDASEPFTFSLEERKENAVAPRSFGRTAYCDILLHSCQRLGKNRCCFRTIPPLRSIAYRLHTKIHNI